MRVEIEDGELRLPEEVLDRYGTQYELLERDDRLLLLPVAEEPLAALREEFADVDESSVELAAGAFEEASEQAER
ncbi:AbrB/MazE/SpoVT family DNA-binding domain-containing protein [Halobaculum sp. MBLA0147]|uniref:AbrB/MazE/SpoVT family DNA-binding domain-containing protein n=1 Tax=Halobaculum sp. MBLA0147 TaxID=3079934 RepID=UPI0035233426